MRTRSDRRRGMTLLYMSGMAAVMFLVVFAMHDSGLRHYQASTKGTQRAQAEWVAKAGLAYARAHVAGLKANPSARIEKECGAGVLVVTAEKRADGGLVARCEARVPGERPGAVVQVREVLE